MYKLNQMDNKQQQDKTEVGYVIQNVMSMITNCPDEIKSQFNTSEIMNLQCVTIDCVSDKILKNEKINCL